MASAAKSLMGKVCSAAAPFYSSAAKVVGEGYSVVMKDSAPYIVKDPAVEDKLLKQWFYTKMSKLPAEWAAAEKEAASWWATAQKWQTLPLSQVSVGVMFGAEVYAWFCVGEFVGRGMTLSGYEP